MRVALFFVLLLAILSPSLAKADAKSCVVVYLKDRAKLDAKAITRSDAENLVYSVAQSIGLSGGLTVVPCTSERNASAWYARDGLDKIPQGDYLIFNPTWVRQVTGDDKTQVVAILGHELGHLFNRHFTSQVNTEKRRQEGEADQFAGCAVAKMKGKWRDLEALLRRIRFGNDPDYPTASESIELARSGFEKCGGNIDEQTLKKLLLTYDGPDISSTKADLVQNFPSKILVFTDTKRQYYEYQVRVANQPNTLRFILDQDNEIGEVTLQASASATTTETVKGKELEGDAREVVAVCGQYYPKLLSSLQSALRERGDPFSSTKDQASSLSYYKSFCRNKKKYTECSKDAEYSREGVDFQNGAKVHVEKQSYRASLYEKDSFQGYNWENTWRDWSTDKCAVTVKIGNAYSLRDFANSTGK
ncbi:MULTISPECIES: hypothetical protein [unclassified Rhizobium]|uniref:hypothetical protein n=1 Tax=unclassified Rhizobium TaxID=2613769 RepID=UPI00381ACE53